MKKNNEDRGKTLEEWMTDKTMADTFLADAVGVRRETVWRWRVRGLVPRSRLRKRVEAMAECKIIFGVP